MFCALLGQDIRSAFTGPLVLWFRICIQQVFSLRGSTHNAILITIHSMLPIIWGKISLILKQIAIKQVLNIYFILQFRWLYFNVKQTLTVRVSETGYSYS